MGMTEVEPGRWVSGWQGSDQATQELFDSLGWEGKEQLDLLARAGRVQNEFDREQSGAAVGSSVQLINEGSLADAAGAPEEHFQVELAVFVAVKESSANDLDALKGDTIEVAFDEAFMKYPTLPPSDAIAVALRKLGIKAKTIDIDAHTAGPDEGPDPRDYPGFRTVLIHFPGALRMWMD